MNKSQKIFLAIGSTAILTTAVIGGTLLFAGNSDKSPANTKTQSTKVTSSSSNDSAKNTESQSTTSSSSYKDGTYTTSTSYSVPEGYTNSIEVSLTIANSKVTTVTVNDSYDDHESQRYIDGFESSIESAIVGKDMSGLSISRLSGASLTSSAFNNVLDTIRSDAAA